MIVTLIDVLATALPMTDDNVLRFEVDTTWRRIGGKNHCVTWILTHAEYRTLMEMHHGFTTFELKVGPQRFCRILTMTDCLGNMKRWLTR